MDIFSHILWVYVPFRNKLWRDEALLFAALPDIGTALIFGYVLFGTPMHVSFWKALATMPPAFFHLYYTTHSFVTLGAVALIMWKLKPKLLPALSGWLIHIFLDIPFHDGDFGTRFLYPLLPDFYISGITWVDYRVMGASFVLLFLIFLYTLYRERHQHLDEGKPDWLDCITTRIDGLINRKPIIGHNATERDNERASIRLFEKDRAGTGQGQALSSEPIWVEGDG
jgi:hypothetical protein